MLFEFFLERVCTTMIGWNVWIYVVQISEKCMNLDIFTHNPYPKQKSKCSCHFPSQAERNYSFKPGSSFSKICFPQQQKWIEEICFTLIKFNQNIWRWLGTSERNIYFDWGWTFTAGFTAESVPEMINKEVLTQFIYWPN